MKKYTKTAGILFMAASSVYYGQAVVAAPGSPASGASGGKSPGATDVRLLEELTPAANPEKSDPSAPSSPTTPAATDPNAPANSDAKDAKDAKPIDAAKPEGRSVSKSEVNVSDEGTVEIHVNDASLVEVLRMLSLQSQKNIICSKEVKGTVTANLYNVTIREALDQILQMNGYAYREKGNFINVYTVKELQQIQDAEKKVTTETFRLYYTNALNAMTMIKPALSGQGQVSATIPATIGITASGTETGGNAHAVEDMLVVTDYPENLERVRKILKELDHRPQQVLVEATILRASLSEDNALGVDFNVLAGVKFTDFTSAAGQITGANTSSTAVPHGGGGSAGTGNSFSSSIPGGFKLGFVSDNVSVFLSALEGVTDTVVLANPKVLAVNKQKGEVIVGRKDGYITTTVTQSASVQTVEFLDTGTKLIFRPYIADDGFIRMELHPEDSSGGLTGANLPFKITTEMTSNIMVKDGHTIVIGGLFRESSDVAKSQTPFLGNLPVAGALFRNQRDRTNREEIIILLTPHIIKDDEVYGKLSEDELKRAEKMRVGTRRGMMPWGRERLAEGEYDKAMAELKKEHPNNQKVLWHLDCATNLNPKFIEAIELKQKITGKEVTSVDTSSIRGFVRDMVLQDRDGAAVPPPTKTGDDKNKPAAGNSTAAADEQPLDDDEAMAENDPEALPPDQQPANDDAWDEDDDAADNSGNKSATTQSATQPASSQPTSQPAFGQPSSQPSPLVARPPTTQPSLSTQPAVANRREQVDGPSSRPTGPEVKGQGFTVTELPTEEEVKPARPSTDYSK
jgi:type IV pilus assembly protein PilQ